MIQNMFYIEVCRKCYHTATAEVHCAHLRLYWYNRYYNINLQGGPIKTGLFLISNNFLWV